MMTRPHRIKTLLLASTLGSVGVATLATLAPGSAQALQQPTIEVDTGPAGELQTKPSSVETVGPLAIDNDAGQDLYWVFSTSPTWSGTGTLLGDGQSTNTTVGGSGYILFSTSPVGPSLAHTTVTKTDA